MGIPQPKQTQSQLFEETLKQFDIIDKQSTYILFQNKTTMQKLEFWTFKYNDEDSFKRAVKDLTQTKTCQTLLQIVKHNTVTHDEFCSTFYELQLLVEHPVQSFAEYLQNRGQQDYSSKELYHLIDCVVFAQLNLEKKQYIGFNNLWQGENDVWKLRSFENSYRPIDFWGKQIPHLYPAPEELKLDPSLKYSVEKATIFTFGMLLLHVALAKSCDSLYQNNTIDQQRITTRIAEFSKIYPSTLADIISNMVQIDPFQRYNYQDIQNRLKDAQQCKITDSTNLLLKMPQQINSQSKFQGNPYKSPAETSRLINIPLYPEQQFINSQSIPGNNSLQNYGNSIQLNNQQLIQTITQSKQQQIDKQQPQQIQSNRQLSPYNSRIRQDKLQFADGRYYEGEIMNEQMNGQGILYYSDSTVEYDGQFLNGQFHGFGVHSNNNPDIMDAFLNVNEFPGILNYWVKYEGDFYQNKKHGIGSITFSNGDYYIGGFQKDQMEGRGTYTQKYGQTYIGFWEGNKLKY
ncbi:unnamed protein product [Paramecium sonneborni]|uniref:Protein kinase domain-containing protein n=1 Tax=Paramecium sonneborni TaxID=65129 RepID=A0A8S1PFL4_9CILI|nr:unnamed protein product [Paramecium sonneborni]